MLHNFGRDHETALFNTVLQVDQTLSKHYSLLEIVVVVGLVVVDDVVVDDIIVFSVLRPK